MAFVSDTTTIYTRDFRVGEWWVRATLNRLECGDKRIQLEPKSMQVLVDLAEHALVTLLDAQSTSIRSLEMVERSELAALLRTLLEGLGDVPAFRPPISVERHQT